jgi:hypothetical protein
MQLIRFETSAIRFLLVVSLAFAMNNEAGQTSANG